MTVQALPKNQSTRNIFDFILPAEDPSATPDRFSPSDFGYEVSEEELAKELSAQTPYNQVNQTTHEVDPQDFETIYQWFLA